MSRRQLSFQLLLAAALLARCTAFEQVASGAQQLPEYAIKGDIAPEAQPSTQIQITGPTCLTPPCASAGSLVAAPAALCAFPPCHPTPSIGSQIRRSVSPLKRQQRRLRKAMRNLRRKLRLVLADNRKLATTVAKDGVQNQKLRASLARLRSGIKHIKLKPGPRGQRGHTGKTGAPGARGAPGAPGKKGRAGPAGPRGAQGKPGAQGATGPRGGRGPAGRAGAGGAAGKTGRTGRRGARGKAGRRGRRGPRGRRGRRGPRGFGHRGLRGHRGTQGPTGRSGLSGRPGRRGAPGPRGPRGPTGRVGCRRGWRSLSGGHLCMGPMYHPNTMFKAEAHCARQTARVCTYNDMEQACGSRYNPFMHRRNGWLGDHGSRDDVFFQWNVLTCHTYGFGNLDGGVAHAGQRKWYRCCY